MAAQYFCTICYTIEVTPLTCAWSSRKASLYLTCSDQSWVICCCSSCACLRSKCLTADTNSAGKGNRITWSQTVRNEISRVAKAVKRDFLHWLSTFSVFYRQCRWGSSARWREGSTATFSSWPGNVQSAAPEAESALKQWSCTGTSQTGNATPGRAQRDTRHLPGGSWDTFLITHTGTSVSFEQMQKNHKKPLDR